jgi:LysM repeat protein
MFIKLPLLPLLGLLLTPLSLRAASSTSQEAEYQQVRTIALRDPKVRAAYAEADRKLAAKILQIDPALESYLRHHTPEHSTPTAANPTPKPAVATPRPFRRAHVVVKGDTLGSIAAKYGVTVAALKTANHIADEKKLAVGQVLAVPNNKDSH